MLPVTGTSGTLVLQKACKTDYQMSTNLKGARHGTHMQGACKKTPDFGKRKRKRKSYASSSHPKRCIKEGPTPTATRA
eukprot:735541-Pelagomonas_calceolata.AAC.3